jgi:hypothetical protein
VDLRTEINELARSIDAAEQQHRRQVEALKHIAESLKTRATEEFAVEAESSRLDELDKKITALELDEPPDAKTKKPAATGATGTTGTHAAAHK